MIGIIAGKGNLPKILINKFNKKKIKYFLINLIENKNLKKIKTNLNITDISKIIKLLKKNNCREVILVGKVVRPSIQDFKFDFESIKLLPKILFNLKKGDSYLLDLVIKVFKKHKINVISCLKYLPEIKAENFISSSKPSKEDMSDIHKGRLLLNHINS